MGKWDKLAKNYYTIGQVIRSQSSNVTQGEHRITQRWQKPSTQQPWTKHSPSEAAWDIQLGQNTEDLSGMNSLAMIVVTVDFIWEKSALVFNCG